MKSLRAFFFPDPVRELPHARAWNIALRTAHIAVTGILLGGHMFDVAEERLRLILYLCLLTGIGLVALEAYPSCRWFAQGRGILVLAKLGLLGLIPWFWEYRVGLLLAVVVIASVGAHMPSRFRYYSILHRRILEVPRGQPGWQPDPPKFAEARAVTRADSGTNPHTTRVNSAQRDPPAVSHGQPTGPGAVGHRYVLDRSGSVQG